MGGSHHLVVTYTILFFCSAAVADNAGPEQISLAFYGQNADGATFTWITEEKSDNLVNYGTSPASLDNKATSDEVTQYEYGSYTSGYIHHVSVSSLSAETTYYYQVGSSSGSMSEVFSFTTPPKVGPEVPYSIALVGDLGQTSDSQTTVQHLLDDAKHHSVFLVGDLSYADRDQDRWDNWGHIMQPITTKEMWMFCPGNHEIEHTSGIPDFLSYSKRFKMPVQEEGALWYSYNVASAHIISLNSFTDFSEGSDQYNFLVSDLGGIDRKVTPFVFVMLHAPWYNSNHAHHGDGEEMRQVMEPLLYKAGVDAVFAGHVHAYERNINVYNNKIDPKGPIYITVGDGGNREGPADKWYDQPEWSAYRKAKFGFGRIDIYNSTHAQWTWHRDEDNVKVVTDSVWMTHGSDEPVRAAQHQLDVQSESNSLIFVGVVLGAVFVAGLVVVGVAHYYNPRRRFQKKDMLPLL